MQRFRAPALPIPPAKYDSQYMLQLVRALGQYFTQVDSAAPLRIDGVQFTPGALPTSAAGLPAGSVYRIGSALCVRTTDDDAAVAASAPAVRQTQTTSGTTGSMSTVVLPNDSTFVFVAHVVARRADANDESAGYRLEGVIDRNTGADTTALVGSVTTTVLAEDTAGWDIAAIADTTGGGLQIQVTGEAAKTINWAARVDLIKVTG